MVESITAICFPFSKLQQSYEVPIAMKAIFDYIDTFSSRIREMEQQKRDGVLCKKEDKPRSLENFLSRWTLSTPLSQPLTDKIPIKPQIRHGSCHRHCKTKPTLLYLLWNQGSLPPNTTRTSGLFGLSLTVKTWECLCTSRIFSVTPKTSVKGVCDCRFRWRRRLLIISSPSDEEWSFQQQLYSLNSQACNLGMTPVCFWC